MALHAMLLLAASIASTTALSMNRTINACQSSSTICDCQPTLCDDITVFTELEELYSPASHCTAPCLAPAAAQRGLINALIKALIKPR